MPTTIVEATSVSDSAVTFGMVEDPTSVEVWEAEVFCNLGNQWLSLGRWNPQPPASVRPGTRVIATAALPAATAWRLVLTPTNPGATCQGVVAIGTLDGIASGLSIVAPAPTPPGAAHQPSTIVYVDAQNGDDATGVRGDIMHAFRTIQAGVNASQSGDVVMVYPGIYAESVTIPVGADIRARLTLASVTGNPADTVIAAPPGQPAIAYNPSALEQDTARIFNVIGFRLQSDTACAQVRAATPSFVTTFMDEGANFKFCLFDLTVAQPSCAELRGCKAANLVQCFDVGLAPVWFNTVGMGTVQESILSAGAYVGFDPTLCNVNGLARGGGPVTFWASWVGPIYLNGAAKVVIAENTSHSDVLSDGLACFYDPMLFDETPRIELHGSCIGSVDLGLVPPELPGQLSVVFVNADRHRMNGSGGERFVYWQAGNPRLFSATSASFPLDEALLSFDGQLTVDLHGTYVRPDSLALAPTPQVYRDRVWVTGTLDNPANPVVFLPPYPASATFRASAINVDAGLPQPVAAQNVTALGADIVPAAPLLGQPFSGYLYFDLSATTAKHRRTEHRKDEAREDGPATGAVFFCEGRGILGPSWGGGLPLPRGHVARARKGHGGARKVA